MSRKLRRTSKSKLAQWLSPLFARNNEAETKEDLIEFIKEAQDNELIDVETFDMIEGVLDIAELRVRDIMIPRYQMIPIKLDYSLAQCVDVIFEYGHSRYPVISDDRDHIEGILLAKDLLMFMRDTELTFDLKSILRPTIVIPESKRVDHMLKEFKQQRYHMAIVVDEFGGVSGLLTIEDILELIVGDIEDEYDEVEENEIRQLSPTHFIVSALTDIETFNETFKTSFSDDDVDTIGGLVMQEFGRLPEKGETTAINGITFSINAADKRRIIALDVYMDSEIETPINLSIEENVQEAIKMATAPSLDEPEEKPNKIETHHTDRSPQ